ncbi:MAG TPA: glycosyltransferase [Rhizomicrobium sp.]|jgi:glycosyltransferase involved in cell wall biosynthesis
MTPRILFATDHIHFPQGGGGGERNTHELSVILSEQGFSPAVMAAMWVNGSWLSWRNRLRRILPPRVEFPCDMVCGYPVFRGWDFDRCDEVVRRFKPDVAVVQSTAPAPLMRTFARTGVPMALYVHEVESLDYLRELGGFNFTLIANSDFTARRIKDYVGLESQVVLPLIDARYYKTRTSRNRVLFVNTVPRKGLDTAFAIAEHRPDIQFDFVLSWILKPERIAELEARASRSGNITLHPPTDDMRSLYATAKLLLVPSQWEEAWGRVVTEAHLNGIPVLGSDRGGLPESIGTGGLILPPKAPIEDWLAALSRIWDDPDRYESYVRAARACSNRPEIQPAAIVTRLSAILEDVIASAKTKKPTLHLERSAP